MFDQKSVAAVPVLGFLPGALVRWLGTSLAALGLPTGWAHADSHPPIPRLIAPGGTTVRSYLQCVPFARSASGVQLYGDAWTWWEQAESRYDRGSQPQVGAVMSFRPHGKMVLGHVAVVSRLIDPRTVQVAHANWSIIKGRRGQIERDVLAVDTSHANDWSQVRVWYAPLDGLGASNWPLNGFIYPHRVRHYATRPVTIDKTSRAPIRRQSKDMRDSDPIGAIISDYLSKPHQTGAGSGKD